MSPRVSILLPNLNNRRFLLARLESIFRQTYSDWELIVVDNHSEDGAWEYFVEQARGEPRMRISQAAREGMYANWNNCIRLARGEFIYIATSDDTMSPDCLETMVAALDRHPDCGLCHCCLTFIDEHNKPPSNGWTWESWPGVSFFGELIKVPHIRVAPHDAIVAMAFRTVYWSITQLLIRRKVFEDVGLFKVFWGSAGDMEWQMRAASVFNTIHVPKYLATWRLHGEQATTAQAAERAIREGWFCQMVQAVVAFSLQPNSGAAMHLPKRLGRFFEEERFNYLYRAIPSMPRRLWWALKQMRKTPMQVLHFFRLSLLRKLRLGKLVDPRRVVSRELRQMGVPRPIVLADDIRVGSGPK